MILRKAENELIRYWNKRTQSEGGFLIYTGEMIQKRSQSITVVPVNKLNMIEI